MLLYLGYYTNHRNIRDEFIAFIKMNNFLDGQTLPEPEQKQEFESNLMLVLHSEGQRIGYNPYLNHMGADVVRHLVDGTKLLTGSGGKFHLDPPEENTRYVINRLVLFCIVECMICKKQQSDPCKQLSVGEKWGWVYCDECLESGRLRETVLGWINHEKTIPCTWMGMDRNERTFDNSFDEIMGAYYLDFFRYSQRDTDKPVYKGRTYPFDENGSNIRFMKKSIDGPGMTLAFMDDHESDDSMMKRPVSLENIFAHNPRFYDELTSCTDLLASKHVRIGYSDVSQVMRDDIDRRYRQSLEADPMSYKY